MTTYESLFSTSKDQSEFVVSYETGVNRLPIFEGICAEEDSDADDYEAKPITSECCEAEVEEACSADSTTGSALDS